eukprot:Platyproteum_vivax@DN1940_c0_g1_i1.p1
MDKKEPLGKLVSPLDNVTLAPDDPIFDVTRVPTPKPEEDKTPFDKLRKKWDKWVKNRRKRECLPPPEPNPDETDRDASLHPQFRRGNSKNKDRGDGRRGEVGDVVLLRGGSKEGSTGRKDSKKKRSRSKKKKSSMKRSIVREKKSSLRMQKAVVKEEEPDLSEKEEVEKGDSEAETQANLLEIDLGNAVPHYKYLDEAPEHTVTEHFDDSVDTSTADQYRSYCDFYRDDLDDEPPDSELPVYDTSVIFTGLEERKSQISTSPPKPKSKASRIRQRRQTGRPTIPNRLAEQRTESKDSVVLKETTIDSFEKDPDGLAPEAKVKKSKREGGKRTTLPESAEAPIVNAVPKAGSVRLAESSPVEVTKGRLKNRSESAKVNGLSREEKMHLSLASRTSHNKVLLDEDAKDRARINFEKELTLKKELEAERLKETAQTLEKRVKDLEQQNREALRESEAQASLKRERARWGQRAEGSKSLGRKMRLLSKKGNNLLSVPKKSPKGKRRSKANQSDS